MRNICRYLLFSFISNLIFFPFKNYHYKAHLINLVYAYLSTYFNKSENIDGVKIVSFRGRPLYGSEIYIPQNYFGYVIQKPEQKSSVGTQIFKINQSFKKFTYWNLDRIPSNNDSLRSAFDWLDVAEVVHSKITPEELNTDNSNIIEK
ncbi:hypothetical protein PGB90_005405 [Kerria lacca]